MKVLGAGAALVLVLALSVAQAEQSTQPAVWSHHALIIDLHNLPKRYSCDELWYKFKDVLLAIGARPDLKILPYRCGRSVGSRAFSPKIQLEFSLPRPVSGKNARWASVQGHAKSVRLEPGAPLHLEDTDCELLNQIRTTLLRAIDADVTGFRLACRAPAISNPPFELTVKAILAISPSSAVTAGAAATEPGRPSGSGS